MTERNVTFYRWDDMPKEKVTDMLDRRLITADRMMLAHVYLKKGTIVPRHSHENEQITYILEGGLRFWIGEDESQVIDVMAGEVLHIPSLVQHKAEASKIRSTSTSSVRHDRTGSTRPTTTSGRSKRPWISDSKNKVALVAAGSRGLGRAVAEELAAEGASLVLCARDVNTLTETAAAIADAVVAHMCWRCRPTSRRRRYQALVEAGIERFGRIDILVTNAGGPPAGTFDQLTREQWEEAIASDSLQRDRIGAPGFAGNETKALGTHTQHHLDRGEATG